MHSNKIIRLHTPTHTLAHTYVHIHAHTHTHTHASTYTHTLLGLFKLHNFSWYAECILRTKILPSLCCNAHLASPTQSHALKTSCPHQELLGGGASTPGPLVCLICTIISKKTGLFDLYQNTFQVLAARYLLVTGFDTRLVPRRVSCGMSKMYNCNVISCYAESILDSKITI